MSIKALLLSKISYSTHRSNPRLSALLKGLNLQPFSYHLRSATVTSHHPIMISRYTASAVLHWMCKAVMRALRKATEFRANVCVCMVGYPVGTVWPDWTADFRWENQGCCQVWAAAPSRAPVPNDGSFNERWYMMNAAIWSNSLPKSSAQFSFSI